MLSLILATTLALSGEAVAARVDQQPILAAEVQDQLRGSRGAAASGTPAEAVDVLAAEVLLAGEAERRGLPKDPAVAAAIDAELQRLATERFLAKEVDGAVRVDEATLREFFHSRADVVRLHEIVVSTEPQARAILDRLAKGGSFAAEARNSLDVRSAPNGGDRGDVARGDLDPALAAAAFQAPIGKVMGPVTLQLGVAVFKVTARSIGAEQEYAEKRAGLERFVRQQSAAQMRHHYLTALRAKGGVKLDEEFLRGMGARLRPSPEEGRHVLATVNGAPVRYADILPDLLSLSRGIEGGHLSGPKVKAQVAWSVIDRKLLDGAARQRGFDKDPEVALRRAGARRMVLARTLLERLRGGAETAPAQRDAAAVKLLDELRAKARITVDDAVLQQVATQHVATR
ncbi:peptidylprolyl isomerase [Anaeromyxobacter paludicola]|uniref:PpiC domain-containing protein n=1 Tax=Anaeromyxobacter paludicola TaxID=2918171 RepID=A0ABN6N2I5_9BACT|nr:peptidylprolyl isomerase [Anaeromyxobacter paludicola]BDG07414.1 hypothetical protein AMPC_05270 [Anaeromyxobacter paludicola]